MLAIVETTTIDVDPQAAEILRRASETAKAQGRTLGAFLRSNLSSVGASPSEGRQRDAWPAFVTGMTAWSNAHLPAGHIVDDSREAMYGDRD